MMFNKQSKINKLKFSEEVAKVEKMYDAQQKKAETIKKQQRKIAREKGVVASMAAIGVLFLSGLILYYVVHPIPMPHALRIAIYLFVIIPSMGWVIILINKHLYGGNDSN